MNKVVKIYLVLVMGVLLSGHGMTAETTVEQTATIDSTVKESIEQPVEATININTASAMDIAKVLQGVGLRKAEAIVQFRTSLGKFERVEQLLDVKGIGPSILNKNRSRILL